MEQLNFNVFGRFQKIRIRHVKNVNMGKHFSVGWTNSSFFVLGKSSGCSRDSRAEFASAPTSSSSSQSNLGFVADLEEEKPCIHETVEGPL
jgi:hypothetical protein